MKEVKVYVPNDFDWERWRDGATYINVQQVAMHLLREGCIMVFDHSVDDEEVAMSDFSGVPIAINYIESITNLRPIRSRQIAAQVIVTAFFFQVYV